MRGWLVNLKCPIGEVSPYTVCVTLTNVLYVHFRDYILDQLEGDRKLLVFAHHRVVMDGICEFLTSKVIFYVSFILVYYLSV